MMFDWVSIALFWASYFAIGFICDGFYSGLDGDHKSHKLVILLWPLIFLLMIGILAGKWVSGLK